MAGKKKLPNPGFYIIRKRASGQRESDLERSTGSEPICNVVILGPVSESSREQLITGLQQRFRLTAEQVESLLQRAPVVVKRGLSLEKAQSFVHRLEEIGAKVRIERVFPEQEPAALPRQRTTARKIPPPMADQISPESYCLWEDMENLGFLRAFFGTIGEVLFHPSRFYSRMPVEGGLLHPLIFALVMGVLGGMFGLVYQFLTMFFLDSMFEPRVFGQFSVPIMIGWAIGLPILTIIGVFIGSGVLHVCLMIVRGNRNGFEATFRVIAYAMSTQIFTIIPFLGGAIGGIWALVVEIVGLRESHGISTGRAALAIFLPALIILVLLVILAAVLLPIIFRAISGA